LIQGTAIYSNMHPHELHIPNNQHMNRQARGVYAGDRNKVMGRQFDLYFKILLAASHIILNGGGGGGG
jgi:hypothetical protein